MLLSVDGRGAMPPPPTAVPIEVLSGSEEDANSADGATDEDDTIESTSMLYTGATLSMDATQLLGTRFACDGIPDDDNEAAALLNMAE